MLTKEKIDEYIQNEGLACPYCGSTDLEWGDKEYDLGISQPVRCAKCGKEWTDVYTLTTIEEDECTE